MRDIKFRAFIKSKGSMGENSLTLQDVFHLGRYGQGHFNESDHFVMQYTGLKDKNGVEIYEGDIVRLKFRDGPERFSYEAGVVKWHEGSAAFKWFAIDEDPSDENNYWLTHADDAWREVIGNIYEHPHLLESRS